MNEWWVSSRKYCTVGRSKRSSCRIEVLRAAQRAKMDWLFFIALKFSYPPVRRRSAWFCIIKKTEVCPSSDQSLPFFDQVVTEKSRTKIKKIPKLEGNGAMVSICSPYLEQKNGTVLTVALFPRAICCFPKNSNKGMKCLFVWPQDKLVWPMNTALESVVWAQF